MSIIPTKYGDTENGNIVFGVSKFGYSYGEDSFPSDAELDFTSIISEHGDAYDVLQPVDVEDSMGRVISTTNTYFRATGMFQDIGIKDRKIHEMGLAVPGNRKFYFETSYTLTSGGVTTTYELKEGDIVTDSHLYEGKGNTGQWRVVKVLTQWWEPGTEVYRLAILKNINLDGS